MEILLSISSKTDGSVREVRSGLDAGLVVGRGAEGGVLLEGPDLSREHLILTTDGANFYVTDLSSNGTWLNGTRLRRSIRSRVRAGDSIEVPGYVLSFRPADEPAKEPEKPEADAPAKVLAPIAEESQVALPAVEITNPPATLDGIFQFVGSFSFGEKFLILVGLGGLLLLYIYAAS